MNLVEIAGFLGADAEERFTATGKRVVSLRVATRVRQGGKDDTIWWRVNIWGDRFDKMIPYLKKGTAVIVLGELSKPETYVDKNGQTQISLTLSAEVIKFSPFGKSDRAERQTTATESTSFAGASPAVSEGMAYAAGASPSSEGDFVGDDLPF